MCPKCGKPFAYCTCYRDSLEEAVRDFLEAWRLGSRSIVICIDRMATALADRAVGVR